MSIWIKPKIWRKGLHNWQTHVSHFQVFIFDWNSLKEFASLYSSGRFGQRRGILYDIVSKPYLNVFLFSFNIIWKFLKLRVFSLNIKQLSIIAGAYPFIILKTSIINTCRFLWWIVLSVFLTIFQSHFHCHHILFE